ncbi:MAG: hypothetical protein EXR77_15355 [Myxococcales bacterium]|nr:hypothetical protein [Myxococcales bacterium]
MLRIAPLCTLAMVAATLALVGNAYAAPTLRVAVMDFTNTSPSREYDALGKGLQSMIATDLAQVPAFQLVERARLSDITAELKLGKTALVDKATAVKLGKLAGATHLLAGTFAVVGEQMRIDSRLFAVSDGTVLLGENMTGEKDAFFELEKALVVKIVAAAGVVLAPKDRGVLAKVHTTDFEAFRSYSQGMALFDDKKYQEAIAALRAAASRDADFKLAAVTLAEYQQIIARLQSRADELQASQIEVENLNRQKLAGGEAEVIQKLFAVAGDKDAKDPLPRLAALYLLAVVYGNISRNASDISKLQEIEDRFALQRVADTLVQSYWTGAVGLFPRLPALVRDQFNIALPSSVAEFTKEFTAVREELQRYEPTGCAHTTDRATQLYCNLAWYAGRDDPVRQLPRRLRLDVVQEADLYAKLYQLAGQAKIQGQNKLTMLRQLALAYRYAAEFSKSSALFTNLAGALSDPGEIRAIAAELELNRQGAELVSRPAHSSAAREYLQAGSLISTDFDSVVETAAQIFTGPTIAPRGLQRLNQHRKWPSSGRFGGSGTDLPLQVGDQTAWLLQANYFALVSGPRTNLYTTQQLRYFLANAEDAIDNIVLLHGSPRKDVQLRFEISYVPAADWWPPQQDPYSHTKTLAELGIDVTGKQRPEVGVLFGIHHVNCDPQTDAKTGKAAVVRPMRGQLLALHGDKIGLYEVIESERGINGAAGVVPRIKRFGRKLIGQNSVNLQAVKLAVAVAVVGTKATVTVNGNSVSFAVEAEHTGIVGLSFRGAGFAAIGAVVGR